ncbi:hypothetical protein XthCFBP4691_03290 [Xanthomonas theicola]|uniref:Uncharacterized protein n=1 Tax=Xanthomonas theicola TaxID=56464 RepID=A0A2S6ZKF9_9XANT|nr:hypothetical protein XthCFBP4691_03290 [Xanthomonas theicola]
MAVDEEIACFLGDSGGPAPYGNAAIGIVKAAAFAGAVPGKCGALAFSAIGKTGDLALGLY